MRFDRDRAALRQMTTELPDYLLSEVLFWPLAGSGDNPKLSLGSYLLTRARLAADQDQRDAVDALNRQADATLARWAATAERKAAQELPVRLRLWETYLMEGSGRYATEVAQRAIAALLVARFPGLADTPEGQRLPSLDAQLRGRTTPGPFVWEPDLQPAFPEPDYWFLYRSP